MVARTGAVIMVGYWSFFFFYPAGGKKGFSRF